MKTNMFIAALAISFTAILASCEGKKAEDTAMAVDQEQIKSEITAMENAYAKASNEGDAEGVAAYYSDDATSYSNEKGAYVGKAAIKESIQKDMAEAVKGNVVSFDPQEFHVSNDGNQVVEVGAYNYADSTGTKLRTGTYMSVFEKRDGKYLCVRDMAVKGLPIK